MDRAKVFKDYFISRQNTVLIPNEDFGRRKFINVGVNRRLSLSQIEETSRRHIQEEDMRSGNKQWIHPPDALTKGHILYNVKFYGECEVDSPKGTEVVKEAIRKRKFNKSIRKTEGQRTPKVEISISVDGVAIQDPKTKMIRHQYPLHRISYCADDKSDKRMFTFIAKSQASNTHYCYVFASERNAEEITLTIGQAFDLAYRRFLETQGKDADLKRAQDALQRRVKQLEQENTQLKQRIRELEALKDRADIEQFKQSNQISSLTDTGPVNQPTVFTFPNNVGETCTDSPQSSPQLSAVGRRLENLMFEPSTPDQSQNGETSPRTLGIISPPPQSSRPRPRSSSLATSTSQLMSTQSPAQASQAPFTSNGQIPSEMDELAALFESSPMNAHAPANATYNHTVHNNANPFISPSQDDTDPFGMASFVPSQAPLKHTMSLDSDMEAGFSQGLSFGTGDFGMDSFDPFNTN
ncbi:PTB domain-containing adapter protein ced-6-like isoform X1 [Dreissena polymorpha]|uniref:PTB domain-containing adapter protein ced-6-like isoform X1 n=1 Tax=Dreissena polymorpha TaxID=45954 RepID=UPI0022643AEC|nr:PTB domain-containing adapter protein ced-6-like isoform X1 [Dreissena polymorpha]XP_052259186.1 PTB domain-containing adapter protein ced-6-like isoform X1 [Dreissena polymorpha]XP_052259187.1 PTB domain-containing adapter protein ced-6-like isoform X1 [Dreissena polymorpha]XP_052259188.1 PTB domain-containing adapter protein ced-6-like isoform X1 [Dreissena polymorpha]XP_052259189.1 PTB domain-containing adapter protein ced-6-like isoform X1 [Dreissena polymorpha]XP_052259190.1 PTB domain